MIGDRPGTQTPTVATTDTARTAPATRPSGTPVPTVSPTPTPVPTSGPDQDVTHPPTEPSALAGPASKANAAQVATYFLRLFPYAVATGDLAAWDELSSDTCRYCATVRRMVEEIHGPGNHGTGGAYDITSSDSYVNDDGTFVVVAEATQYPSQTIDPKGRLVEDFPGVNHYRVRVGLTFDGRWTVTGVQVDDA